MAPLLRTTLLNDTVYLRNICREDDIKVTTLGAERRLPPFFFCDFILGQGSGGLSVRQRFVDSYLVRFRFTTDINYLHNN